MQLNPDDFNNFLGGNGVIGQDYAWYSSNACPCVDPNSGQPDPACPVCDGQGRIYAAPVPGVAALSGAKTQRDWAQFGLYEKGDVVVTVAEDSPMYVIGQYDRVTALNETNRFSVPLRRGATIERLLGSIVSLSRVFWLAGTPATIVDGDLPTVNADGTLTWAAGANAPPEGVQYSVTGLRHIDYFCFGNYPQNRRMNQGSRLPIKVVLRDWDLFNR
ncbi:hypothetical protein [Pararobbsia silviterrae]|uniref:Uncharacterized protein n=1 Tax=Pararobbsia silviterrae TaxID=1792498 RepID=A0A494XAR2_9BURK|nr:hypothetical protein [Pararobbsia silviterrae]RKP44673.1 hypothetical protein D7S86_26960 [Pararobbsia silviterrae]